jgi:hypothetical protein
VSRIVNATLNRLDRLPRRAEHDLTARSRYQRTRRYVLDHVRLGTDPSTVADGDRAQDDRVGADDHVGTECRVPPLARQSPVVLPPTQCAQRHLVVKGYVVADHGRLTDHGAASVVDEQPSANPGTGVDLNATG